MNVGAAVAWSSLSLLGGCAGASGDAPPARPAGPPAPWETMGFEAKKAYMKAAVLPRMRQLFQAYDAKFFADFSCETCHGLDAESGRYEMPNEELFVLYPTGHEKQIALVKRQPAILRFMFGTVVPEMRTLLGAAEFDPATGTGFSCFACHPRGE